MIRKSMWLASAGLFVLSTPAMAQQPETQPVQPDTTQTDATPTEGSTAENAAVDNTAAEQQPVDTGNIIITATRRNQALSDVPMAVSAVTADTLQNSGASDIRQLTQLSPSLLVSSTTSEGGAAVARIRGIGTVGDNPGPRRLGRDLYRRRLSLAHRRCADRAWPARPDRGASRPAGHIVRPQCLGRRDFGDYRKAAVQHLRVGRRIDWQLRLSALRRVAQRAARKHGRGAARRRLCQARRVPQGRDFGPPGQRPRPLSASRPALVPAQRQFHHAPHRRHLAAE